MIGASPDCPWCRGAGWYRAPDPAGRGDVVDCECRFRRTPAPRRDTPTPATQRAKHRADMAAFWRECKGA